MANIPLILRLESFRFKIIPTQKSSFKFLITTWSKIREFKDEINPPENAQGIRVLEVTPFSAAYGILTRGDIITEIKSGNKSFK